MVASTFDYPFAPLTIAFLSDLHFDSPHHDRKALIADLDRAKKRNARIFLGGDLGCFIFARDKRFTAAHAKDRKIDAVVDESVREGIEILGPYADNIDFMALGNHETTVLKYLGSDITNRIRIELERLKKKRESIIYGGYSGYIRIRFKGGEGTNEHRAGGSDIIYYHHGAGGSAPVTRGMIDLYRVRAANVADVYWLGHKHTDASDIPRVRYLDNMGNIRAKKVLAFFTAGYEGLETGQSYDQSGYELNWPEETFYAPQSQGCVFLTYEPKMVKAGIELSRVLEKFG